MNMIRLAEEREAESATREKKLDQKFIHDQIWSSRCTITKLEARETSAWLGGRFRSARGHFFQPVCAYMFVHYSLITLISSSPVHETTVRVPDTFGTLETEFATVF